MDEFAVISIASSVTGVSDIVARSIKGLVDLQAVYRSADLVTAVTIGHLHTVEAILREICDWLKALYNSSGYADVLTSIDTTVGFCAVVAETIFEKVVILQEGAEPRLAPNARLSSLLGENEIKEMNVHLATQIQALQILVDAAHCKLTTERNNILRNARARSLLQQMQDDGQSHLQPGSDVPAVAISLSEYSGYSSVLGSESDVDLMASNYQVYRNAFKDVLERRKARGMNGGSSRSQSNSPTNDPQPKADRSYGHDFLEPDCYQESLMTLSENQSLNLELYQFPVREIRSQKTDHLPSEDAQFSRPYSTYRSEKLGPVVHIMGGSIDSEDFVWTDDECDENDDSSSDMKRRDDTSESDVDIPWPLAPSPGARKISESPKPQSSKSQSPEPQSLKSQCSPKKEVAKSMIQAPRLRSNSIQRALRKRGLSLGGLFKFIQGPGETNEARESRLRNEEIEKKLENDQNIQKSERRILISGTSEGGRSSVLEYLTLLSDNTITDEDRKAYRKIIREDMINGMRVVLEAMESLNIPLGNHESVSHIETIFESSSHGQQYIFSTHLGRAVCQLRSDPGVQACIARWQEYDLNEFVPYWFDNAERIIELTFSPTNEDIMRARGRTAASVKETVFTLRDQRYRIFDVGHARGDQRKWTSYFENVTSVIFTVDMSDYDRAASDDKTANKMEEQLALFEKVINARWFKGRTIILLFKNARQLEGKLHDGSTNRYFVDHNSTAYDDATDYMLHRFVSRNLDPSRSVHTYFWDVSRPFPYEMLLHSI